MDVEKIRNQTELPITNFYFLDCDQCGKLVAKDPEVTSHKSFYHYFRRSWQRFPWSPNWQ